MSENNPFAGLGGEGGFDLNAMLEQAQQMQSQLVAAQDELARTTVQGSAGGVQVTLTGTGELTDVSITAGSFDGSDEESLGDLGDLVVAAYRDAKARVDALASEALGPLAGGLGGGLGDAGPGGQLPGPGGTAGF
jgi:DNA-binding YbaB/EbfC family protein